MALPNRYQNLGEGAVASYDFVELASGVGSVTLYPVTTSGAGLLSVNPAYNHPEGITGTSSNGCVRAVNNTADVNFDLTINKPIILKGKCYVSFKNILRRIGGGTGGVASTFIVNLYKVVGATEYLLGTGQQAKSETLDAGTARDYDACYAFDISTTHLSIGDKIRLNLICDSSSANFDAWFLTDSMNREIVIGDYTSVFSRCILNLPVKIDL
jgi:hypothetical protein